MRAALTIGDFSTITHLSVKTLRRYHEAGLLEPAEIDPHSGYRYYSTAQVPTAQVIRRLRDLGVPVREVGEIVGSADPGTRSAVIAGHLARLESQLDQTRAAVTSLRRLLEPAEPAIGVEHRSAPALTTAAIRGTVEHAEVLQWYGDAMAELRRTLAANGTTPTGPAGGRYDNELFTAEHGAAVVYLPVAEPPAAEPPTAGRVQPFVVPAADLVITVHRGPHDDIDVTYGALGSYAADHELVVAGPVRETYLIGPRDTADAAAWRTEIGWPVFRTG